MNWNSFQSGITELTQDDVIELNKKIVSMYRQSLKEIDALVKDFYLKTLSTVGTQEYYKNAIQYNRLNELQKKVALAYSEYSKKAQVLTEHVVSISASNAYYRSMYASAWLDGNIVGLLPYEMVELIVYGSADAWKAIPQSVADRYGGDLALYTSKAGTLTEFLISNRTKEITQIQNAIVTGLQQGKSYTQMSESIAAIIGKVTSKDGTLTASGAIANALRITRTEGTRAMNAASIASSMYLYGEGVKIEKEWVASLDDRTRATHANLDGKRVPVDEPFPGGAMYPGDFPSVGQSVNCRCTTIDIIDGESPQLRTGRNPNTGKNETFDYKGFDQWAKDNGITKNKYGELYAK